MSTIYPDPQPRIRWTYREGEETEHEYSGYLIKRTEQYSLWEISIQSGEPPRDLRGRWTTIEAAKAAIDRYGEKLDVQ